MSTASINKDLSSKEIPQELLILQEKKKREWVVKTLLATALLAMGIATILLFGSKFLAPAIALVMISSLAIYQYFSHYRQSETIFQRAAAAITQNFNLRPSRI